MRNNPQTCRACGLVLTLADSSRCGSCGAVNNPNRPRIRIVDSDGSAVALQTTNQNIAGQVLDDLTSADRLGRVRFITYTISLYSIFFLISILILVSIENPSAWDDAYGVIRVIWVFVGLPYFLIRIVRPRLHDMGMNGWFGLLLLIPLINLVMFLALMLAPGQAKAE